MELDAFNCVAPVTEAHDDAVVGLGGDHKLTRQGFFLDDERVIARGGERIGQLAENIFSVVMNLAGFAVEKLRGADDLSPKRGANGLMAKTHAKDRKFSREAFNQLNRNTCFLRRARSR